MMRKTTKIRKRMFALCLALTAFLAMPLTAGAALSSTTSTLAGYYVRGALYDYELYALGITECQEKMAYTEVSVEVYCSDGRGIKTAHLSSCNNGTTSVSTYTPDYRYRVQKTISIHHVSMGNDKWNAGLVSFYNGN